MNQYTSRLKGNTVDTRGQNVLLNKLEQQRE